MANVVDSERVIIIFVCPMYTVVLLMGASITHLILFIRVDSTVPPSSATATFNSLLAFGVHSA
jgi:hypothetical protein